MSGSAVPLNLSNTGFPPPATSTSYSSASPVSLERNSTSVIDRAQTVIHRAQTQTSSGRRPLPSIGNRSPPVPPLPGPSSDHQNYHSLSHGGILFLGSSRSPPELGNSRPPPVPGNSNYNKCDIQL